MRKTTRYGIMAVALLVGAAACDEPNEDEAGAAPAGQETIPPQQPMNPELMAQVMEVQQLQAELEPIQMQALEDEALASRLAELQGRIEAAMRAENGPMIDRMVALQGEIAAAQQTADQEAMQGLMMEAQTLQPQLQALQQSVMQRPEIRESVESFEAAHRARMIEIDPEAGEMLDRMDELMADFSR